MLNEQKWQEKWDRSTAYECTNEPSTQDQKNAWKALDLLAEYAGFFKKIPILGTHLPWGGGLFRSMGHGTQYGAEVEKAIQGYFLESHVDRLDEEQHNVEVVLEKVYAYVGNEIKENDSLKAILSVIKEKTGYDYEALTQSLCNI